MASKCIHNCFIFFTKQRATDDVSESLFKAVTYLFYAHSGFTLIFVRNILSLFLKNTKKKTDDAAHLFLHVQILDILI